MNRSIDWKGWIERDFDGIGSPQASDALATKFDPLVQTQITVVFRDKEALVCARRLCEKLLEQFGPDSFRLKEWPFAALADSVAFALALTDASRSDVVLLALRREEPLPESIQVWISALRERHLRNAAAVVALFLCTDDDPLGSIAADQEIRTLVQSAGLAYFSEVVKPPMAAEKYDQLAAPAEHAFVGIPMRSAAAMPNRFPIPSHWGINE